MHTDKNRTALILALLSIVGVLLSACSSDVQPTPETITVVETVFVTREVAEPTQVQVITATPEPEPTPEAVERALVVCMGQEPASLYLYGGDTPSMAPILEAIYDGPMDTRSFSTQPVILDKIPSLADGDALIQAVDVSEGDAVVDAGGSLVTLTAGVFVHPSGCTSSDCAVEYSGESTITMDQMVVTFEMLPGLKWSDGTPLTVHDSVYAFQLAADPETPNDKFTINRTASYDALDDLTVQWIGVPGYMDSQYFTNFWPPLPEHDWGRFTAMELMTEDRASRTPLGWGPFVIESWQDGEAVNLVRNENYFRADEGLPKFERLVYRFIGDSPSTGIAKLISGECDIVDQTVALKDEADLLLELHKAGQITAGFTSGTVWEHLDFGINPASFDDGWTSLEDRPDFFGDQRTRHAVAMCLDRQTVVDEVLFAQAELLDTFLPPDHPLYNENAPRYFYDVESAAALLEELGWLDENGDGVREYAGDSDRIPQGTLLEFNYLTTNTAQRLAITRILGESLRRCGIKINFEFMEPGAFLAPGPEGPLFGRQFDLAQWSTDVRDPCLQYLSSAIPADENGWSGQNVPGYSNPEYDAACTAAVQSLPGQPDHQENHLETQMIFASDLPVVPLFLHIEVAAARPDMCNFKMDPTADSELWNVENLDYGDCVDE